MRFAVKILSQACAGNQKDGAERRDWLAAVALSLLCPPPPAAPPMMCVCVCVRSVLVKTSRKLSLCFFCSCCLIEWVSARRVCLCVCVCWLLVGCSAIDDARGLKEREGGGQDQQAPLDVAHKESWFLKIMLVEWCNQCIHTTSTPYK